VDFIKSFSSVVEKIVDFAFRSIWSAVFVFLFTSVLLYASPNLLESIYVKDIRDQYISIIGLFHLAFGTIIGLNLFIKAFVYFKRKIKEVSVKRAYSKKIKRQKEWLDNMSQRQFDTLYLYIRDRTISQRFDPRDEDINLLAKMGIIHGPTSPSGRSYADYTIEPWVKKYVSSLLEEDIRERTKSLTQTR
jgi:hypothetical protein